MGGGAQRLLEPQARPLAASVGVGLDSVSQPDGTELCPYLDEQGHRFWLARPACQHLDLALGGACRALAPALQGCGFVLPSACSSVCSSVLTHYSSSGKPPR